MVTDLKNKIVIVTGATGHLGKQITKGFLECGSLVIGLSSNQQRLDLLQKDFQNSNLTLYKCNISSDQEVQSVAEKIKEKFLKCDVLVNNANFGSKALKPENLSTKQFAESMEGTSVSTYRVIHSMLDLLALSGCASIVNIASMYGMLAPDFRIYENKETSFNPIGYGAGKAAIIQMTKYLAVYLADKKIRVNCVSPGPFPNPETVESDEFISKLESKVPMKRIGKPEEVVPPILFLASQMASYVTGHNLVVDGGWTVW